MIIHPLNTANGFKLWIVDGQSEEELNKDLSLGYIEWKGIRMNIEKVQEWNPTGEGLVTKLVNVDMPSETADKLNSIMIADLKAH